MRRKIKNILIPVDFEDTSVKAVRYSAKMTEKLNGNLLLLYVIHTPGLMAQFFSSGDYLVKITNQAKDKLQEIADEVKKEVPGVKINTRIELGKPYEKILEVADESGATMIVLGENHHSGDPEDDLGTTVYHVTLKAKIPVLTLKEDTSKMKDSIVVPLDLTKQTREQLLSALYYGLEYGATIHLVSAVVGGIKKTESRIYGKLKEAQETLEMNGLKCEIKLFDRSKIPPFKRVLEYAEDVDAGMILLMTHQEGYTYDNYIGAFAHHIMNMSKVPVFSIASLSKDPNFSPFFKTLVDPIGLFTYKKT
ncbi:Nucleotide-binding universal stress protein, UspA family [Mariniphaga anaerophila]|uniref:Nucleotide-binding universal stress protein, UspA family n=1 Tax=Mariniphaga anaerophila TaxID=1484053 RepID=A0A1M5CZM8_9BACT|nr:universal stress protein [Mariniphaga anaerophila]SHF60085.1 Nucleotide-binding universal stress protein, UspA family [Mariniphaga anaerophila]